MPGTFIVLDGPDGAGTTTQARLLSERLEKEGHSVVLTAEPTDGPIGEWIRELLRSGTMTPLALQILFSADRARHIETVIEPALKAGKVIVSDRYWYSTIAYAEAQGLDTTPLLELNKNFIQPSAVIFTLPPLSVCLERMKKRAEKDVFEQEDMQKKVHAAYRRLADEDRTIEIVDTSLSKEESSAAVYAHIKAHL